MPPQQGDSLLGFIHYVFDFRSHFPLLCSVSSSAGLRLCFTQFRTQNRCALLLEML